MRALLLCLLLVAAAGCSSPSGPSSTSASDPPSTSTSSTSTTLSTSAAPIALPQPVHLFFDFGGETAGPGDLSGWTPKADVPQDPNNPGHTVAWNVTACDQAGYEDHVHIVYHPVHSACFALDGRQGDGTVWLTRRIEVVRGTIYEANVTLRALGQESANHVADVVLRLGVAGAEREPDFVTGSGLLYSALRAPLDTATGWTPHNLTWTTPPLVTENVVLDIGISAVWETEMTRYLDAVTVDLVPVRP